VAVLLDEGGPVRVSVRPCCVLALVGGDPPTDPDLGESLACAATEPAAELIDLPAGSAS
jgi:hypothetical protein